MGSKAPPGKLTMPPPVMHARSQNEDGISTPGGDKDFTSPYATPQGSPSKSKLPPGTLELPSAFDSALTLEPNLGHDAHSQGNQDQSPTRSAFSLAPGSPLRKTGKENTPTTAALRLPPKTTTTTANQAALSRQEQYAARDSDSGLRARFNPQQGLTADELEKLQSPKVKRLANVTQLCEYTAMQQFINCTILSRFGHRVYAVFLTDGVEIVYMFLWSGKPKSCILPNRGGLQKRLVLKKTAKSRR